MCAQGLYLPEACLPVRCLPRRGFCPEGVDGNNLSVFPSELDAPSETMDPPLKTSSHTSKYYYYYCLQGSCGKVMFLHLSVILLTGGCQVDPPRRGYVSYWNAFLFWCKFHRPQTKFEKVMFLHVSVILSTRGRGGVCPSACWDAYPPLSGSRGRTPWSSACWEIRSTSGRYASYLNAFLFYLYVFISTSFVQFYFVQSWQMWQDEKSCVISSMSAERKWRLCYICHCRSLQQNTDKNSFQ